jgi:hypothetical protein
VERALLAAGWTPCGAGDWTIALRSPDGAVAARTSPVDPTGPYAAALCREGAPTCQVPELFVHRRLTGGDDLQIMERLEPVPQYEAVAFHRAIKSQAPEVAEVAEVASASRRTRHEELPSCGPPGRNPSQRHARPGRPTRRHHPRSRRRPRSGDRLIRLTLKRAPELTWLESRATRARPMCRSTGPMPSNQPHQTPAEPEHRPIARIAPVDRHTPTAP